MCDVCLHLQDRRAKLLGLAPGDASDRANGDPGADRARREAHFDAMTMLKRIYKAKIRPLEQAFKFSEFYSTELTDGDFDAKPFVLLVGQYSVGKTSFIKYMLMRDFPGSRIGPEPTTDRFLAVMSSRPGHAEGVVPGNAAAVDVERPFASLSRFGVSFLSRFEVAELQAPILDAISFVDTPGILSGEKQRVERGYSYEHVVEWFAERSDRILLLFDAHKLDISDELKRVIECLKSHDDKMRIVLNKADMVDPQQLMRVYGALMWSLGKVHRCPEVLRVYIGSFWDKDVNVAGLGNKELFDAESTDLLDDLRGLPQQSAVRKINELVKRTRLAKVHAVLVSHLRASMPMLYGHKKVQEKLSRRLAAEYTKVERAHNLASGDFPPMDKFRAGLAAYPLSDFPALSKRLIDVVDGALTRDIPKLLLSLGAAVNTVPEVEEAKVAPTPAVPRSPNPFMDSADEENPHGVAWAIDGAAQRKWSGIFEGLVGSTSSDTMSDGAPALSGGDVRELMLESGLSAGVLRVIWDLSDVDGDGRLDRDEFAVAMSLIKRARMDGPDAIPAQLPADWVPPSKRYLSNGAA